MNNKIYFDVPTPIGVVFVMINGVDSLFVSTEKQENFEKIESQVTVRGKQYRMNCHCRLNENGQIDATAYAWNGNDIRLVAGEKAFKSRGITAHFKGVFTLKDPTDAAKEKMYDEIIPAINAFYQSNKEEIQAIWKQRDLSQRKSHLEERRKKLEELKKEMATLEQEIAALEMSGRQE